MNAVRCYIQGRQNRWDECVPQIAAALRASVNRSTGLSPNCLMLGRELTMPLELMFAPPRQQEEEDTPKETYVSGLEADIQEAHALARETLSTTQRRMKADYDVKARSFRYAVGDAVYICDKASIKDRCDKLKSPWKGPALVLAVVTPYLLKVQNRNAVSVINHDHVKLCKDRILPKWLSKARRSLEEGEIYCIYRGPDTGRAMVQCNQCLGWFHCDCIGRRIVCHLVIVMSVGMSKE